MYICRQSIVVRKKERKTQKAVVSFFNKNILLFLSLFDFLLFRVGDAFIHFHRKTNALDSVREKSIETEYYSISSFFLF